jgi:glycosyltransferase involved in cell wall biosynthesis
MQHKPKLLRIITWLPVGGIEKRLVRVLSLLRNKYDITVCCIRDKQGAYENDLKDIGIRVRKIHMKSRLDPVGLYRLYKFMKNEKFDIVHTHMYRSNTPGRIAAKFAGIPVIIANLHNIDTWKTKKHFLVDRMLSRYTDKIIAVSDAVKEFNIKNSGIDPGKFATIYNGIDIEEFNKDFDYQTKRKELGVEKDELLVGIFARLYPQKGHKHFLEAASKINEIIVNVKFMVVGEGPLESELKEQAMQLGIRGKVIFTGLRHDIPELLNIIDVSTLSSFKEGFSNIILESMAAGKPVVATDVGGNREAVINRKTGFIVPPANIDKLANAIIKILDNKQLRIDMGRKAREHVAKFSIQQMACQTDNLYKTSLAKKR